MDLILWRHAETHLGSDDLARPLTAHGSQQAQAMAHWLKPHLPCQTVLLASQAKRSQQTAAYLNQHYQVLPILNPGATVEEVLHTIQWPNISTPTVLVGHQPYLGGIAALLLSQQKQCWHIKRGAIWWICYSAHNTSEQVKLKAVITPNLVMG